MMLTSDTSRSFERLNSSTQRIPSGETMDQPVVYRYEHLREADEIRLLHLHRGKSGDPLRADLKTLRIREGRYYKGISYTWADESGDTTKCCSLEIGSPGALLPITRSCDLVLRQVRNHNSWIWIDPVCINQEDVRQRGQQVDLMPRIYKSAVRTFAYVGEASEDSKLFLRNLADGIWTPPHLLDCFFARPYFSRVWVVQEVALSKSITMMCGDAAVEWTGLMQGEYLRQLYSSSYYETFPTLFRLRRQHHLGGATLLDALLLGRGCNASDPRDKVFGLLGIVSEKSRPRADYSLSTAEVYTQVAMYLPKVQRRALNVILGNLCRRSDEARAQIKDLPSWVPNWNQCGPRFLEHMPGALAFLAFQRPIFDNNDGTGMSMEGQILGTLKTLGEHTNISGMRMYLLNSRHTDWRELPPAYNNSRVYVFAARSRISQDGKIQWPLMKWQHRGLPNSILQTIRGDEFAFLIAPVNGDESARTNLSAQRNGERKGKLETCGGAEDGSRTPSTEHCTPGKASTELSELSDGSDGSNWAPNFEFLGLVDVRLTLPLSEVASRINSLGDKHNTIYTTEPRTIRIV